ncbi:hypothetical protein BV20DRAFT_586126 [Pilatotrama ljubarskyi]|nr:hypothetical protein BV20DRAFT_586126 [Pilatotrama ljubarskyi]
MPVDPEFQAAYASDPRFQSDPSNPPVPDPAEEGLSEMDKVRRRGQPIIQAAKDYYAAQLPPASTYRVEHKTIPVEGATMRLRCIIPAATPDDSTYPILVWFHGGGWAFGDIEMDDSLLRTICVELQMCAVNVEYRLAPEHPFPIPINDSFAAVKWVAENQSSIQVCIGKGFILGGDSAGAHIATVCAHFARDDPALAQRKVTGQLLRQPAVVHPDVCPQEYQAEMRSMAENKDSPILSRDAMVNAYTVLQGPVDDPRVSPLLWPSHAGVAPAFIMHNGADPLRDDARILEKVLREAGVKTKSVLYPGMPHGFYYVYPEMPLSRKMYQDLREGLKWLLELGVEQ